MRRWAAWLDRPLAWQRSWLLQHGLLLLLALDLWCLMVPHGARYGLGGFNVAHFGALDLLPIPGPPFYVGLTLGLGGLAMFMALAGTTRLGKGILAAGYTFSWAISLHDSYQHHYLLSWLLMWMTLLPDTAGPEGSGGGWQRTVASRPGRVTARGWPMTAITCAIVYGFTGVSKSEAMWRSGAVLKVLSGTRPSGAAEPGKLDAVRDGMMSLGFGLDDSWRLMALGIIGLQWLVSLAYLAAPGLEAADARWRRWLCQAGLAAALGFHCTAEVLGLFNIGWFSYYMILVAFCVLAPADWCAGVVALARAPARWLRAGLLADWGEPSRLGALCQLVGLLWVLPAVGWWLTLPGAVGVGVACAVLLLLLGWWQSSRAGGGAAQGLGLRACLCAVLLWAAGSLTDMRFDYHRWAGGEAYRLGDLRGAVEAYERAERVAPAGKSRARKLDRLRDELARSQGL